MDTNVLTFVICVISIGLPMPLGVQIALMWWARRLQRSGWGVDAQTCSMCAHKVPVWFARKTHADCVCGEGLKVIITCNICRGKDDVYPLWGEAKADFEARKATLPRSEDP